MYDRYLDPPDAPDYTEMGVLDESIEFSMSTTVVVDEEGDWDFEDSEYPWVPEGDHSGDFYDEYGYGVYLDDEEGIIEKCYDLLETSIPAAAGRYSVSGHVILSYEISGIESLITDRWEEPDGSDSYSEEIYSDNAQSEYIAEASTIERLQVTKI